MYEYNYGVIMSIWHIYLYNNTFIYFTCTCTNIMLHIKLLVYNNVMHIHVQVHVHVYVCTCIVNDHKIFYKWANNYFSNICYMSFIHMMVLHDIEYNLYIFILNVFVTYMSYMQLRKLYVCHSKVVWSDKHTHEIMRKSTYRLL